MAYYNRAQTYAAQKKYELAIDDFTRAISLDQRFVQALVFRGLLCFKAGRFDAALQDFDRLLALDSTDVAALIYKGDTYRAQGNWKAPLRHTTAR